MQAAGNGQTLVTTFNLQGQGLYPLTDQGKQALLNAVNQTLAAKGAHVANISLGQVTVRISFAPECAPSWDPCVAYSMRAGSRRIQKSTFVRHLRGAQNSCAGCLCALLGCVRA